MRPVRGQRGSVGAGSHTCSVPCCSGGRQGRSAAARLEDVVVRLALADAREDLGARERQDALVHAVALRTGAARSGRALGTGGLLLGLSEEALRTRREPAPRMFESGGRRATNE